MRVGTEPPIRANFRRTAMSNGYRRDRIPLGETLDLLDREVRMLGAEDFILELDVTESDIRLDGMIRANARPSSEAVAIAFESHDGPLLFACGRFDHWHDNVRAIALGLEALRKVDRYGITQSAEQYTGFRALPAPSLSSGVMTQEQAAAFLIEHGAFAGAQWTVEQVIHEPQSMDALYRQAAKRLHPDQGGSDEMFMRLQEARQAVAL
jgi:hypothetical protein